MVTNTGAIYNYHFNATGFTIAMTDMSRNIVNAYQYDPFGNVTNQSETITQPFKFVGQFGVMTEPNGFYYMRARYYDPNTGRFISEDPIGFGGGDTNLMAYVGGNPVVLIDPSGLSETGADLQNWNWHHVFATREGLVGLTTANGHVIQENDIFVALPSRAALNKQVELFYNGTTLVAPVWDVGPWNTKDPYWLTNTRPQAESGRDLYGRSTNGAGIDLSNEAFRQLGLKNNNWINWRFINE